MIKPDKDTPYSVLFAFIYQDYEGIDERIASLDKITQAAWKILYDLKDRKGFD
ncbi:TPA: hypothetical protein ACW0T4_003528 [Morganella morganii]